MSGIWENKLLNKYNELPEKKFSLGEGNTPLINLQLNNKRVLVKDENANPTGSFKDRCLAFQISYYYSLNKKNFVISSSGNAAVSAGNIIKSISDATIDIFISKNINPLKLEKLVSINSKRVKLHQSDKAKSDAILFTKENNKVNLRASNDDIALIGYKTIAYELEREAKHSDGIFIPASSGTAVLGIGMGFEDLGINIPIYLCQTTKINSVAKEFDEDFVPTKKSLADAIVDRVALRKDILENLIRYTNGDAYVISDEQLMIAKKMVKEAGKEYSYNSLLGFAGYLKALKQGRQILHPIILASGL